MLKGCCKKQGLLATGAGLALSIRDAISHAASTGEVLADYAEVEKRLALCSSCPEKKGGRCQVCGCFVRLKAGLASSGCPLKKW